MHLYRWLTALAALPILIYLIGFAPRWAFYGLLCLISVTGLIEFYSLTAAELPMRVKWPGYVFSLLLFFFIYQGQLYYLTAIVVLWAFVPMVFYVFTPRLHGPQTTGDIGKTILGPVYVSLPIAMVMIVDRYPNGNVWIFFLLAVVFASDTGAFYCGKLFGRHKLYEAVSPGKTWEGAVGGLIASLIVGFWFAHLFRLQAKDFRLMALVVSLCISGQMGDLAESLLKRNHGVKDSGRILPGHGGILDRIDGLLFASPLLYIYLTFSVA